MKRNEIMCAFYNQKSDRHMVYEKFMDILNAHRKLLKPLYYENDDGKVLMVFYKRHLKKFEKIIDDINVSEFLNDILNNKHYYCSKCGCGYMAYYTYTYRDNCGCVSRSYECEVCLGYSDSAVRQIRDYARKRGTKKALLKVLNGKFFKTEYIDNGKDYDEDLPF